ncbi:MAG: tetratricopeptide repeat protein [Gemmataceae bacterium]
MLFLLSKMLRRWSRAADSHPTLPSVADKMMRERYRIAPLLGLLLVAGLGIGAYAYAEYQWREAQKAAKEEHLEEAQRHVDFCLMVWPRSVPVHLLAARVARLRGDLKGSESHLLRCKKYNGGASEDIQLEFYLLRVQAGEVDTVAPELLRYVENDSPESPLILETLARVYMQNLRYGPAFEVLRRWHELQPDSPEPHRWRGWVLERMNDRDGAIKEYKQALKLDADNVPIRFLLAEAYLGRFDPQSALPHLKYLQDRFPERPDVLLRLGECRFNQGEPEEARRLLEAAREQLPNDTTILFLLAKIEIQASPPRYAEAEVLLRRALEREPTYMEAKYQLIQCVQSLGRANEAQALQKEYQSDHNLLKGVNDTLRREAERPVTDPAALCEVGKLFLRGDNDRLARYWLKRALALNPNYQPALKALADHYESKGELNEAAVYRSKLKVAEKTEKPERQP